MFNVKIWVSIAKHLNFLDISVCKHVAKIGLVFKCKKFKQQYAGLVYGIYIQDHHTIDLIDIERILVSDYDSFVKFTELWHGNINYKIFNGCRLSKIYKYCPDLKDQTLNDIYSFSVSENATPTNEKMKAFYWFTTPKKSYVHVESMRRGDFQNYQRCSFRLDQGIDKFGEKLLNTIIEWQPLVVDISADFYKAYNMRNYNTMASLISRVDRSTSIKWLSSLNQNTQIELQFITRHAPSLLNDTNILARFLTLENMATLYNLSTGGFPVYDAVYKRLETDEKFEQVGYKFLAELDS